MQEAAMNEMEQMRITAEQAKVKVDMYRSLEKLRNNEHFKKLFIDGYLESYAARLVRFKADMGAQDEAQQMHIASQLNGIGALSQYMLYITTEGRLAEKGLEDLDEEMRLVNEQEEA
jgi:hypothetical protein